MKSTSMTGQVKMPRRPWWQRLFRPRPSGTLELRMVFMPSSSHIWRTGVAIVRYPEGIEDIRLVMETYLDGEDFILATWPDVTVKDDEDGEA